MSAAGFVTRQHSAGFSLIELMIVVVVVGILAAVAYPNYSQYVIDGRRSEAQSTLAESANRLERCFTRFNAYTNAACATAGDATSEGGWYLVTSERTATTYALTAAPQGVQAEKDDCGSLTLSSTGLRGYTGTPADSSKCW